ncbi:MAG TPA: polysaccharide biosynthesis tyrosine autokinase [Streptosporangiaceae bacterium]|jgi:capsular exopolysaccharide synthesis family protein
MAESGIEPTLRTYLMVLRCRKWWVVVLTVLGLAVSLSLALTSQKQYTSTAQLLVQSVGGNQALNTNQAPVTSTDVQTQLQLVTSARVQKEVRAKLGSAPPVSAAEVGQTNVIAVTAVSPSPARAALIANTYANAFVESATTSSLSSLTAAEKELNIQITSINNSLKRLDPTTDAAQVSALSSQEGVLKQQLAQLQVAAVAATEALQFVTPASAPSAPSSPRPAQDALLGLLIGLVIGIGAAFLRDSLDDTLNSADIVERVSGLPVLSGVPLVTSWKKREDTMVIALSEPTSPEAEAYRSLRTSLQFARQSRKLRTVLVTSPSAAEGKTATLANLGAVFAQAGERVVLVSCDLRRPRLSQFFDSEDPAELVSVLLGQQSLDDALRPVPENDRLWTLGAWAVSPNPTELLSGERMRDVFAALEQQFDLVLIDSPPVLPVSDAVILTAYADAVLLVVAAGQTRRNELKRTVEKLTQTNAPVLGMVLNKVARQSGYGYGGYGHSYGYSGIPLATPVPAPAPATGTSSNGKNGLLSASSGRHGNKPGR